MSDVGIYDMAVPDAVIYNIVIQDVVIYEMVVPDVDPKTCWSYSNKTLCQIARTGLITALTLSSQIFVNPPRCCHVVPDFVIHDIQDVVIYGMAIPDVDPDGLVKIKPHVRLLALGSSRP